ncbi:FAD-dependent oxidoreductase [Streptomyces sp. OUCMDZ-4982]|uniref:flavin monoamine oxidase family protein n=1 Tax=Streptomyces sp. OUCMDZ-4982 TaxID=2973090 RepID=UPI00215CA70E|nr:NAD(P)/FAD-dependent oxidoreductase [Streptomyces sp. OUCMDZ-4982]MCR8943864.1 FAD-dependent oxidoreductase [Streptomyces sp. OUCMDZ-4982]
MPNHEALYGTSAYAGDPDATVVVVGAGLSGLTAARELHRRGVDVLVLEAADRIGGRAMAETTALGSRLDLGGQWIGHDHHRIMALAAELGATRYPMHTGPVPQVIDGGRRLPLASPSVLPAGAALAGVGVLSLTGTPERWNDATVDAWLRRVPGRVSRRLLEVIASISWTADLDRYSVHAMARMVRQQGGLRTILSTRGGAQDSLLVEGVGTLTDRLAAELGARVRTGHRVTRLVRDEHGVTVHTDSGTFRAARTIVTVPPPVAARIEHHPPLPADRAALERNTYMGSVYKAIAVFERPFWRDRGRAEFLVLDSPGRAVFDTGSPGGPGHLCTLVAGPEARALDGLDAEERRQVLLAPLVPHLGTGVLKPVSWHEKAWHLDEHAGGGYVVLPEPGTTEGISPLPHTPLGPVHWAGTETADEHAGYLEGAIASGVRAAREVADALAAGVPR